LRASYRHWEPATDIESQLQTC